jgi:hypothetical protein
MTKRDAPSTRFGRGFFALPRGSLVTAKLRLRWYSVSPIGPTNRNENATAITRIAVAIILAGDACA